MAPMAGSGFRCLLVHLRKVHLIKRLSPVRIPPAS
jgi:hypothetical protein